VTCEGPGREFIAGQIDTVVAHLGRPGTLKGIMDFLYFSKLSDREFGDSWRQAAPELAAGFQSSRSANVGHF